VPNVDIVSGAGTRLVLGSGVVLTTSPFNLRPLEERVLFESGQFGGTIRTIAYRFV
jgi:hypothetical protein